MAKKVTKKTAAKVEEVIARGQRTKTVVSGEVKTKE